MSDKANYVRRQRQDRNHECHWPDCDRQVPPAMWGCKSHWFKLPKRLRDAIWDAYVPGQERRMDPSDDYLAVAHEVQEWIRATYPETVAGSAAPTPVVEDPSVLGETGSARPTDHAEPWRQGSSTPGAAAGSATPTGDDDD